MGSFSGPPDKSLACRHLDSVLWDPKQRSHSSIPRLGLLNSAVTNGYCVKPLSLLYIFFMSGKKTKTLAKNSLKKKYANKTK